MKQKLLNNLRLRAVWLVAMILCAVTGAWADEVTDKLTQSWSGVTSTSYSSWEDKTATSDAVYAGNSAGGNSSIQLRSNNNNSGIVTTTSGGKVKSITVEWQSSTSNGRTLNVYGKNSAYSDASDLYNSSNQGDLLGTIVYGTSTTLEIDDDYEYIGFRSASGAMYLTSVSIVWTTSGGGDTPTLEDNDLALTGAPIALNFDLYNNASAQVLNYSTSSTGAVTVSSSEYIETEVDAVNKTITVTPVKKTASEQTITVNQAADATYAAGSVTFTVSIGDSTPFTGGDVTFTASSDMGTSPITKQVVTFTCSNGVLNNGSEYRLYKNSETTFSLSNEAIASGYVITGIAFTGVSGNPASGFASQDGWTTNGNNGTWTGSASSVSFTASGAQVRATEIVVTVGTNAPLSSISLSGTYPTTFHVGDAFSYDGIIVTATYEDESTKNVTASATFSGYDMANAGDQTVTVSYTENEVVKTATYDITVNAPATLTSIALSGTYPTEFQQGDEFSSEGIVVTANYDDQTTQIVTGEAEFLGYNMATIGEQTVTVSYGGKTATYSINVAEKKGTEDNPYTVAEIIDYIETLNGATSPEVFVRGIISQIDSYNDKYHSITYWISDNGSTETQFECYSGLGLNSAQFSSIEDLQIGDQVVVAGTAKKYGEVYEYNYNNYIVSLVRKPVAPTFSPEAGAVVSGTEVALSTTTEDAVIYYTLDGSVPTTSSTEYTEAIEITEATTIKAIAVKNDVSSDVSTATYTIEAQITRINAENVNLAYDATSGEIAYTITNPVQNVELAAVTTADWISNIAVTDNKVTFTTTVNSDELYDRQATITLSYTGAENKVITVTQARTIWDYVKNLPFEYDGNGSGSLPVGLTQSGLGTYTSSPAMKFDGTGDVLVLKFNERPGTLTFDIKGNSFSGGTFKVQTSSDGVEYTDLETYTELGNTQNEEFTNLDENVRYIKWIYTEKSNGNVALGNISLAKYSYNPSIALSTEAVEVDADEHDGTITVSYNQITNVVSQVYFCNAEGESATYNWIEAEINNSNNVDYVIGENTSTEARTAYMKVYTIDDQANDVYSNLITITQAGYVPTTTYTLVNSITPGKRYIIANGSNVAMGVQNTNNRAAVDVTITEGTIKLAAGSGVQEFVIYGPDANGYYSIYDETEEGYLYAASSGSNHLKTQGTNDANGRWSIEFDGESVATITAQGENARNLMRFNSGNNIFSCYGSGQDDIYLYESEEDAVVTNVKVQLNDKGFATYASDNTLDFLNADASFSAWQVTGVSGSTIQFEQIESTVASGKGIMLMGSANAEITINILPAGGSTLSTNKLVGITEATEVAADTYFGLKGNEFVKVNAGTIAAGKAVLPASLAAGVKSFTFNFNGVPTGVNGFETVDAENARIFNLAGQRLSTPQKGLNIVNGKKVLVK